MTLTLTIVRHGNTFEAGQQPRRIGARTDLPLVESGRTQARQLSAYFRLRGVRFGQVLASPLRRTMETAALILDREADAQPIETRDWLAEIDHGPDEGSTEQAVIDRIGRAALSAWDEAAIPPVGWDVRTTDRFVGWRALFDQRASGLDGDILLVTSNGAARFALFADEALAAQAGTLPTLKLRTGSFGRIAIDADGPRLEAWDVRP